MAVVLIQSSSLRNFNVAVMSLWTVLLILVKCFNWAEGANILMVHPVVSRSHELVFITLGEELANRGHNVTLVRFKGRSRMPTTLINVVTLELQPKDRHVPYMNADGEVEPPHDLLWKRPRNFQAIPLDIIVPVSIACETLLDNNTFSNIFAGSNTYDVAIVDLLFNECGMAFVNQRGLPVVAYWASIQHAGELFFTSSTMAPAIVPSLMTEYTDRMSFYQRFINTCFYFGSRLFATFIMVNPMQNVIAKYLPNSPHPSELIHNVSMLFINSDFTLDFARPITPNTIYIGCIQCRPPKPLPKELEEFMLSSGEHGVIVFSLGATFSEGGLPMSDVKILYEAFGKLKQKVILKMSKNSPHVKPPDNVKAFEWLPQQDILGHPKTRLMVTHCGMHGVLEAIYHGVPMVGIPIFGDQGDVFVRMEHKGIAIGLQKENLTSANILAAISAVLTNRSFSENVKNLSAMIKDNPQSALERAVYWIEYVVRHRGAGHLKTSDRHLNLAQYLLLDILAIVGLTLFVLLLILRKLFGLVCVRRNNNKTKTKKNNNIKKSQ